MRIVNVVGIAHDEHACHIRVHMCANAIQNMVKSIPGEPTHMVRLTQGTMLMLMLM